MRFHRSKISLFFLFVVALIGTVLRTPALIPPFLEYGNLVHAHSHVAFQGWIYTLMLLALISLYLSPPQIQQGRYWLQFKFTVLVIIGVLITFSWQGYALYAIIFATLFQLLNYWFIYCFLRDTKGVDQSISLSWIKTGLVLGLLSTLVPIAIGILASEGLGGSEIYNSLVYTFLHLQYNGWFLFVALGLFYKLLENHHIEYDRKSAGRCYWLFTLSVLPAIALSLLGMSFAAPFKPPAYMAAALQLAAIIFFLKSFKGNIKQLLCGKNQWFQWHLTSFLGFFVLKTLLQGISVFPLFRTYAFHNKQIILAYLHLSLIGVISFLLLATMIDQRWLRINSYSKAGNMLLLFGFVATELGLVFGGLGWISNPLALSIGSAAMALGIVLLIISPQDQLKL
jgi:hypothetical protein